MPAERKVAVVTAGGSGIGAGAARKLAQDGFHVAILSSSGKGEALAHQLGGIGVTGFEPVRRRFRPAGGPGDGALGAH